MPIAQPDTTTAAFPRAARVRARAEFDRVFKDGRRIASPLLALHVLTDAQAPRLGLAVSRKVDPHAVVRNRIKRRLRDAFRRLRARLPPGAYVVVARPSAAQASNETLRAAFEGLLQRAGALPPAPVVGTMPPVSAPGNPSPQISSPASAGGTGLPAA